MHGPLDVHLFTVYLIYYTAIISEPINLLTFCIPVLHVLISSTITGSGGIKKLRWRLWAWIAVSSGTTLGPSPLCCYTCLKDNICICCGSIRYTNTKYIIMEDVSTHRTKIYLNHCSCVFSCHLGTPWATLKIFHWGILLHVGHFFSLAGTPSNL